MDLSEALTEGFQRWLEDVMPASESGSFTPGRVLDPYRSSMRHSWNLVPDIISLSEGGGLVATKPGQRFSDLQNAGLVAGTRDEPELSDLGRSVLSEWVRLQIATEDPAYEVARAVVLAKFGISRDAIYRDIWDFWSELRVLREPHAWFSNPFGLYMASYLDRRASFGYRPLRVLLAAGVDDWDDEAVWTAWASGFPVPSGWEESQLHKLIRTVRESASRPAGRVAFCQGIEALHLARLGRSHLEEALGDWGIT